MAEPESVRDVRSCVRIAVQILVVLGLGLLAVGLGSCLSWWLADRLGRHPAIPSGYWCVAALFLIIVSLVGFWHSVTARIHPIIAERTSRLRGLCHVCGYDLTGNVSGVCPECGTPVREDVRRPSTSDANEREGSKPRFL